MDIYHEASVSALYDMERGDQVFVRCVLNTCRIAIGSGELDPVCWFEGHLIEKMRGN